MKKILLSVLTAVSLLTAAPAKPKLVLFIVIDQCRRDYLTRYRSEFAGGFDRLLRNGANFTGAEDDFFPTLTAVSHAVMLTGAMPSATGIVGNDWFDRQIGKPVTSVSDGATRLIGRPEPGDAKGSSPHYLLVSTVGDELKKVSGRSRVFGIAEKDRSAILLAGHKADGVYWLDEKSGVFVTSSYYRTDLPGWVKAFDDTHPSDRYRDATWLGHSVGKDATAPYKKFLRTPFANEITEELAERAIEAEKLGQRDETDILALSLASTDYVGHDYGPDSPEEHETLLRTDRLLEKLFQAIDRQIGLSSVLVVMTADHGVAPLPDPNRAPNQRGGHYPLTIVKDTVEKALTMKYGPGKWVEGSWDSLIYLNRELIAEKKLDVAKVNRAAADAVRRMPHMARAYTREELMEKHAKVDDSTRRVKNGFNPARAADIVFMPEPFWVFHEDKTTHGTTYDYDTNVPLIFMGPGIRAGHFDFRVPSNDIAPTLAEILRIPKPGGSAGRVLSEMFAQ